MSSYPNPEVFSGEEGKKNGRTLSQNLISAYRPAEEPWIEALRRLGSFSKAVNRSLTASDLVEVIGRSAQVLSGADRVAVLERDLQSQTTLVWSNGLSARYLGQMIGAIRQLIEESGRDLHAGPLLTPDVNALPPHSLRRSLAESEGYRAVIVCPLIFDDLLMAIIDCYFDQSHRWNETEHKALQIFSRQAAVAMQNVRLGLELEESYAETVLALSRAMDARDNYTANHSQQLADWAVETARRLNCSQEELRTIRWAALLHDIGKIGVPDSILLKPGPLNEEEWVVMKKHPQVGAEIIEPMRELKPITSLIRAHQEKYDGTGYPYGLQGEEIPLGARILTVVDSFGAMVNNRVYRQALSLAEAAAELQRCAGKHFDRQVVDIFYQLIQPQLHGRD